MAGSDEEGDEPSHRVERIPLIEIAGHVRDAHVAGLTASQLYGCCPIGETLPPIKTCRNSGRGLHDYELP